MHRSLTAGLLGLALLGPATLAGQEKLGGGGTGRGDTGGPRASAPGLRASRASDAPRIDGRLDEPAWLGADIATDFIQFRPEPGAPATERTEVRILYTESAIYVGARMHDSQPHRIINRLARRDEGVTADDFLVGFDSYFDRRTAFVFAVSVAGVQRDFVAFDDTDMDDSWNAVWESATSTDDGGWTAELRIPLSQLRFARPPSGSRGMIWGVNFQRQLAREGETTIWAPRPDDGSRLVSAFGTLSGLDGISPRRSLEIRPYAVGSATRAPNEPGNPFYSTTAMTQSFGGDLKYGITNNLTLDVTINPDFGQVEADPSVVNLSAFETFFPEQRPFFKEGADIFDFAIGEGDQSNESIFYSRRIGRRPQGFVTEPSEFRSVPRATTILGAAKVSGKTSSGWSLGLMSALTGRERARFLGIGGELGDQLVEPATNYAVGRVIKDFRDGESAIGVIGTATNRSIDPDGPVGFLSTAAYSGGVDFRHRFSGGNYQVSGYLLGSSVHGNTGAIERLQRSSARYYQRPDAEHVELDPTRTSLFGTAGRLEFAKMGGGHWRYGAFGTYRTPGFDINAIGFQQSADRAMGVAWAGYQQFEPQGPFRRWGANFSSWSGWNFGGERIFTGANLNGNFQLKNFWNGFMGYNVEAEGLSATALRGGPALRTPTQWSSWLGFQSDARRSVRIGASANFGGEYETSTNRFAFGPNVTLQPSSRVQVSLQPNLSWNDRSWQFVDQAAASDGTRYVFGALDQRTASLTARLNYTFSPDLSFQLYAQPFVSAGTYSGMMEVDDPRGDRFADRFASYADEQLRRVEGDGFRYYEVDEDLDGTADFAFRDPDFNVKSFRSNMVLRWQYRPGSSFFLVWSRDQGSFSNDGSFELGRDFGDVFAIPSTNVFMIKVEHWLGL